MMDTNLNSKVVLIAGADDEIGGAIAMKFAVAGVCLALVGMEREKLRALADQVIGQGAKAEVYGVNMENPESIADCVQQVLACFGRIDILVNNAGEVAGKPLSELAASDVSGPLGTVLAAPFHFIRAVVPCMRQNGFGRVVNISELNYLGLSGQANAAAARAGIFGLTRSVALEAARDGVTVNTVVKGDIATTATGEGEIERLSGGIPVKRLGTTADVARVVSFFAAASSKYLTGQTLFVCGGKSAYFSMSM